VRAGTVASARVASWSKQHELFDRLTTREVTAAEPSNHLVDIAGAFVNVPRDDCQPIDRRRRGGRRS